MFFFLIFLSIFYGTRLDVEHYLKRTAKSSERNYPETITNDKLANQKTGIYGIHGMLLKKG